MLNGSLISRIPNRITSRKPNRTATAGRLGNNRDFASRTETPTRDPARRYRLQRTARALLPDNKGIHQCMRRVTQGEAFARIERVGDRAKWSGVHRCKQGMICPVCAPSIAMQHARELATATAAAYARGWKVYHVTYTLSHRKGDALTKVLQSLKDARRKYFLGGRGYQAIKKAAGIIGSARALEVTYGDNGWHPHMHELLFVSGDLPADFEHTLKSRWIHAVELVGGTADYEHGLVLQEGHQGVSEYLAKHGYLPDEGHSVEMELTHAHNKHTRSGGVTPFGLLSLATVSIDDPSAALYQEYARSVAGSAFVRWAGGLREALGLDECQDAPGEGVSEDSVSVLIAHVSRDALRLISTLCIAPATLVAATVGNDVLTEFLYLYDIWLHPDIPNLYVTARELQMKGTDDE